MTERTLNVHDPRIGLGLPARTSRPFRRAGEGMLEGLLAALRPRAERVVLSGRLFDRKTPPAHLVDRIVRPLGELVERGVRVFVPRTTPRGLLFLAAGVRLEEVDLPGHPPDFWRRGEYRILSGDRVQRVRAPLPESVDVTLDVRGLTGTGVLARLEKRLSRLSGARFVRVVLTGETDDPRVLGIGMRELTALLPAGSDGVLVKDYESPPARGAPADEEARKEALSRARARLSELPALTGVYELLDEKDRVLYVGKAIDVRRRIASHFTAEVREPSPRGPMLSAVHSVRVLPARSELAALLLEARRIRELRPAFNRQMRDPECGRYVRADLDGPLPALSSEPRLGKDGAAWFGPFPKRWIVERSLRVLQVVFGLGSCAWRPGRDAPVACTDRDLSICSAPCVGRIGLAAYRERTALALDHLLGRETDSVPFGALNPLSAGRLDDEDRRVLDGFRRSVRRFLDGLRGANGLVHEGGERYLLVLGGLVAEEWKVPAGEEDEARRRAAERIEAHRTEPAPTAVPVERAEEARILLHWFRAGAGGGCSPSRAPGVRLLPLKEAEPS